MNNIRLYRHPLSGHSHRAELLLSLLGISAELVDIDLAAGEHKKPEFLARNPLGQVPVLEDGSAVITDSNAILVYLARRYDASLTSMALESVITDILVYLARRYDASNSWSPVEPEAAAEVQRFLSAAAGQVAFGPAAARLVNVFGAALDHKRAIEIAHTYLGSLEKHLAGRDWLVTENPTIADVANYAYIAHAPEGDVSLASYPNVVLWLRRLEAQPGFVAMRETPVGLAA